MPAQPLGCHNRRVPIEEVGAYGLRISGPVPSERLQPAPGHWLPWRLTWSPPVGPYRPQHLTEARALIDLRPEGQVLIDRPSSTTTVFSTHAPSPEAWAHPYLSATAATVARWLGNHAFHAGAFVHRGAAWAVLGQGEQGKTTLMAWLASRGYEVLCDDILVLDSSGAALAGPRCLDLRESAARRFGLGQDIGVVGSRRRWRAALPPVPAEVPLGGWVVPAWAEETGVAPVPASARLGALLAHRAITAPEEDDGRWLSLLALPMFELRRPRSWEAMDASLGALLEAISSL